MLRESQSEPEAGPSRPVGCFQEDTEDTRVSVDHLSAGRVIRVDRGLDEKWRRRFRDEILGGDGDFEMGDAVDGGGDNPFHPFVSEMDWRVAQWALKESPGHGTFDRLLAIPGLSQTKFNLSGCRKPSLVFQ
ncbi:hypothetical protein JAAARDRAFT_699996 [Jaapia argillacea MUCL 33604]|uniref:Uncharacterized protein n=1 Tax=Jaapia argillacea MUCL 33604 TaxID=933084 RepID=A0A067PDK4_9AGAM|nr:hypothetical protein JAAARDRAFT_699996 [Jaapia argillacea MUCL 33604]